MVAVMIVIALDADVEITGQEVVSGRMRILQDLMPALDLAQCLRRIGRTTDMMLNSPFDLYLCTYLVLVVAINNFSID
ncbi:hypothetical protein [Labrenzia alba]|uniref:hypothetical protein n=1 Tax=Roseibium album TaxID=311410 RepID=UPI0006C1CB20|nr:hypothetical protein LA5094_06324 [Roseibium album]CTQ81085.1 hypothetical protein LA5095_06334 [Roseibium album]